MCRWLCYTGDIINIYPILYNPSNSIFKQCYQNPYTPQIDKENPRDNAINVDGFGIGLYQTKLEPFLYTSIKTPWSDVNLKRISKYMDTPLLFAHIRGVKPFNESSFIHELNCHPFIYKKYMMMHNGFISGYRQSKPKLLSLLNDNSLNVIKGNVDSEDIFALFINHIKETDINDYLPINTLYKYLLSTIKIIISFNNKISSFNLALTDGKSIICTRYINSNDEDPPSLYIKQINNQIYIASEPLYTEETDWKLIDKNTAILINENKEIEYQKINIS